MTPSNLDHFEERLLEQLRDVVAATPAPSATPRRRPRIPRVALAGGCAAASIAAVAIFTSSGGSTSNAYAIESQPDGVVVVSIDSSVSPGEAGEGSLEYSEKLNTLSPSDAAGLQSGLGEAGIPAVVNFEPTEQQHCVNPAQEEGPRAAVKSYGQIDWEGLGRFWGDLSREGGVAWAELPPFPTENNASSSLLDARLDDSPGFVARDGQGITLEINPSKIGSGEKLFIMAPDGTMETVTMSVSSKPPLPDCPEP